MARFEVTCPSCQRVHSVDGALSFREECDCGADLHVCVTCRFYDRYVENACRETSADPVADKTRRNLCEYWRHAESAAAGPSDADVAKAKLAALFGGAPPPPTAPSSVDDAKARLEALFKPKK